MKIFPGSKFNKHVLFLNPSRMFNLLYQSSKYVPVVFIVLGNHETISWLLAKICEA